MQGSKMELQKLLSKKGNYCNLNLIGRIQECIIIWSLYISIKYLKNGIHNPDPKPAVREATVHQYKPCSLLYSVLLSVLFFSCQGCCLNCQVIPTFDFIG